MVFWGGMFREQFLGGCEWLRILLPIGIGSLGRPCVEYLCVSVILPMGKFGEALVRYLLQYLYQRRATWSAH